MGNQEQKPLSWESAAPWGPCYSPVRAPRVLWDEPGFQGCSRSLSQSSSEAWGLSRLLTNPEAAQLAFGKLPRAGNPLGLRLALPTPNPGRALCKTKGTLSQPGLSVPPVKGRKVAPRLWGPHSLTGARSPQLSCEEATDSTETSEHCCSNEILHGR